MRSNNTSTIIKKIRTEQIINATIDVLASRGFFNTSLSSIGEHIGISKGLIAYHFTDKLTLLQTVATTISHKRAQAVQHAIAIAGNTQSEKLRAFICSDIEYISNHPKHFLALTEIAFHQYTASGSLKLMSDEQLAMLPMLEQLLSTQFTDPLEVHKLAIMIEGARDTFLARYSHGDRSIDPAEYSELLLQVIQKKEVLDV